MKYNMKPLDFANLLPIKPENFKKIIIKADDNFTFDRYK